ncbi:hypothetical protein BO71DRAFT_404826 [Aspergillus ellipticus CBS 707.79]|uniref:Uncharacterized protein n=1 Tax=Aspergillus ellipticus CBS 707.79 TaxID=1448320 RepID=A0A319EH26_9EURO|nr:hypothetical protein BO71DRAFT_404826 [Aspergillus ellipticus CBS 707.79]
MSFTYPEGECFFKRSALRSSTYDPDKPEHFYGHLLVEYIWNRPAFHGSSSYYTKDIHYHPRSPYRVVKGDWWSTPYGNWSNIFFLYGKRPHSDPDRYRQVEHNLCTRGNRFRDQEKGGALESWFMILPMPLLAKGEEWFLVDTMAINIRQLVNLLSLPRHLRGHNCFSAHIVRMVDRKLTPIKAGPAQFVSDAADISWTTVASANYGLSIQWRPPQPTTWLADFIKNSMTVAVGFLPVIGPIAAVCFPLAWTAIADPGSFDSTLKELIPVADLAMRIAEEIQKSAEEQVPYLPKEWESTVNRFKLISAAKKSAAEQEKKAQMAPARTPAPEMVKKFEAVRKFRYWNLMKPTTAAAPSTEKVIKPDAAGEPVQVSSVDKKGVVPQIAKENAPPPPVPVPLSLDELKTSASFQLAGQVLQQSSNPSAATGHTASDAGKILDEVRPGAWSQSPDEGAIAADNDEYWLEAYLYGEIFGG